MELPDQRKDRRGRNPREDPGGVRRSTERSGSPGLALGHGASGGTSLFGPPPQLTSRKRKL